MSLVAPGNPVSCESYRLSSVIGSLSVIPKKKDNFKITPNKHAWILSLFTKLWDLYSTEPELRTTNRVKYTDENQANWSRQGVRGKVRSPWHYQDNRMYNPNEHRLKLSVRLRVIKELSQCNLTSFVLTMRTLTRAHSRKRPALVTTTFSTFWGGRLRELRLY